MSPPDGQTHPSYAKMLISSIEALQDRKGSSRQAITTYIRGNYAVGDNPEGYIKAAIRRGVIDQTITQVKGNGANGSFKLAKKSKSKVTADTADDSGPPGEKFRADVAKGKKSDKTSDKESTKEKLGGKTEKVEKTKKVATTKSDAEVAAKKNPAAVDKPAAKKHAAKATDVAKKTLPAKATTKSKK